MECPSAWIYFWQSSEVCWGPFISCGGGSLQLWACRDPEDIVDVWGSLVLVFLFSLGTFFLVLMVVYMDVWGVGVKVQKSDLNLFVSHRAAASSRTCENRSEN